MDAGPDETNDTSQWPGHSVLQLPVPALEPFVRQRTEFYDRGFVLDDPAYTHAHITALVPFREPLTKADDAVIAQLCRVTAPIRVDLERIDVTVNGLIQLLPDPDIELRVLTARLRAAFPDCVPYWGRYGDVAPHVTLDAVSDQVTVEWVRHRLADTLPVSVVLDELQLVWYQSGRCRLLRRWQLGS